MGDPQHKQRMINIRIGPTFYTEVQGADGPAPIWKDAMSGALASTPPQNFVTVPLNVPNPSQSATPGQPTDNGKHGHRGHGGFTVMGATTGAITGGGTGLPTGGTAAGAAGGPTGGTTDGSTGGAPPPILLPSGGGGLTGGAQ